MSTEIAKSGPQYPAHVQAIQARADRIQQMLPASFDAAARDRFVSTLVTAIATEPKFAECSQQSLIQAAYRVAQLGLDVGINCYLIPQKSKGVMTCRVDPGVKGMVKIALESGIVAGYRSGVIYEHEDYEANGELVTRHVKSLDCAGRGRMIGAYAVFDLRTGGSVGRLLDMDQILRARKAGAQYGPWETDFAAMAEKTALLRAGKYLPFKPDVAAIWNTFEVIETQAVERPAGPRIYAGPKRAELPPEPTPAPAPEPNTQPVAEAIDVEPEGN